MGRAEVAKERTGEDAAGRVGGLPVGLQLVGQVITSVLKLLLIQNHIKQLLCWETLQRQT